MRDRLAEILAATLPKWRCEMLEFGGEDDHVHLLISAHPALDLSDLVNNLKTVTSRRLRKEFADHLRRFYRAPVLWHGAYDVGSVGHASLATVKAYIERQGKGRWPRRKNASAPGSR